MKNSKKLLFGKTILIASTSTMAITILLVFLTGLSDHRSLIDNSLISLTLLAIFFFFFLVIGLYHGLNVYDNFSHKLELTWKNAHNRMPSSLETGGIGDFDFPSVDGDLGSILVAIIIWIVFSIVLLFLLVLFQAILWLTIVLLVIAIYWIIIRALKLIFAKSAECEGQWLKSIVYACAYTMLYTVWIYGIIYISILF